MTKDEEQKLSKAVATVRQALKIHAQSHNAMVGKHGEFPHGFNGTVDRLKYWEEVKRTQDKWKKLSQDLEDFFGDVMYASPRNTQP